MFNIFVDFNRWWQRLNPIRNGVWCCRFELRDVEDRVYGAEMIQKSKGKRSLSGLGDNFVGP